MITHEQRKFLETLKDPEYRQVFAEEHVGTGLAFQIRSLRDSRNCTQNQLAELTGKAQETISQWENPNYGRYTLSTLKQLSAAFDVALLVRFVPFSSLVDWTVNLTPERLAPPSYDQEIEQSEYTFGSISGVGNRIGITTQASTVYFAKGNSVISGTMPLAGEGYDIEDRKLSQLEAVQRSPAPTKPHEFAVAA